MRVSIVVPVYNEERLLLEVLRRVAAVPLDKELVVIDDCSTDGTAAVVESIRREPALVTSADPRAQTELRFFRQERNRGKGAALHRGFAEARGEIVAVQDADFEYDFGELSVLVAPIELGEADVVYGSCFFCGGAGFFFWHMLANWMLTVASNLFTGLRVTDMETCYKVFKSSIIKSLPLREERFGFEPEVTALLGHYRKRHGLRLVERPIAYQPRSIEEGKKIRLKDAF